MPIAAGIADVTELDLLEPGVHPVSIQIRRDGSLVAAHTTLVDVIRNVGPGRGPFTFFVLAAVEDTGPFPSDDDLADAGAQIEAIGELAEALDEPLTIALPPTYLDDRQHRGPRRGTRR